jgi:acyl-CoA reductase-like NAD-dependent aldehyde dehydrogenase
VWLECGGKSPHIVFDDCPDLDRAAQAAAIGIFNNQGEICIAGSRLYVQRAIYDTFMEKLEAHAQAMQPGDPLDPASAMGAIVDARQLDRVMSYVDGGQREGVRLRLGGERVGTGQLLYGWGYHGAVWRGQAIRVGAGQVAARAGQVQRPENDVDRPGVSAGASIGPPMPAACRLK